MKRVKNAASILLPLAVGGGLFYWAFRDVHLSDITVSFGDMRLGWLPVLVLLPLTDLGVRAMRWRLLLFPVTRAEPWRLFQFIAVGLGLNNLLFMRLGELARGVVAAQELKVPLVAVLSTIVVERVCDTAALLALFSGAAALMPEHVDPRLRLWGAAGAAGLAAGLALTAFLGPRLERLLDAPALKRRPRAAAFLRDLLAGARGLRSWPAAAEIACWSLALWLVNGVLFWTAGRVLGLSPSLGGLEAMLAVSSAAAASALPAVPGAFGNFEAAVRALLEHLGYAKGAALTFAAFTHLVVYAVVTSLGIAFLYRLGHTVSTLRGLLRRP